MNKIRKKKNIPLGHLFAPALHFRQRSAYPVGVACAHPCFFTFLTPPPLEGHTVMILVGANVSGGHLWSIKFMQQTYRTITVFQAVLGAEARERGKKCRLNSQPRLLPLQGGASTSCTGPNNCISRRCRRALFRRENLPHRC